ncbi:GATA transcription factor 4-like [Tasmannia lanceolata]|uniref:GATA transcription factor 4-like n=1 Tax=Tasmannia lanceolata TaxID=3420 RepID=UPI004062C9E6
MNENPHLSLPLYLCSLLSSLSLSLFFFFSATKIPKFSISIKTLCFLLFWVCSLMSPEMEMGMESSSYLYGHSSSDLLHIEDLLDFSNDEIFDSNISSSSPTQQPPVPDSGTGIHPSAGEQHPIPLRTNFSDDLSVPSDDVAELEWLSKFVDDSFSDFPFPAGGNETAGNVEFRPDTSFPGRARSKRSRAAATNNGWISLPSSSSESEFPPAIPSLESGNPKATGGRKKDIAGLVETGRKCTHCETDKTPQWRTGPMGPKSLCNACGVRYKSGRLVPEYRPAASPTFVLTQHSNSHRKVMELRRQKESLRQDFFHDFKIC